MLNVKANRTQIDGKGDSVSLATGLDTGQDTLTRQEFAPDADINTILSRFGLMNIPQRTPIFGTDTDYDIDLQTAKSAVQQAVEAHARLSPDLKAKYPTWQQLLTAAHTGTLGKDLDEIKAANAKAAREAEINSHLEIDDARANRDRERKAKTAAEKALRDEA